MVVRRVCDVKWIIYYQGRGLYSGDEVVGEVSKGTIAHYESMGIRDVSLPF